jgi:hypothetical protein
MNRPIKFEVTERVRRLYTALTGANIGLPSICEVLRILANDMQFTHDRITVAVNWKICTNCIREKEVDIRDKWKTGEKKA